MSLAQRWQDIRDGFERPFWVANISELFERISYYGMKAFLVLFLVALVFMLMLDHALGWVFPGARERSREPAPEGVR